METQGIPYSGSHTSYSVRNLLWMSMHIGFKALAFIIYVIERSVNASFFGVFFAVSIISAIDFWIVKNLSGRFLVGMRWWNMVDEEGNTKWIFENRKNQASFYEAPNPVVKKFFWGVVIGFPGLWTLMALVNLLSMNFIWLTLNILVAALCWANLVGYFYCNRDSGSNVGFAQNFISDRVYQTITSGFTT
ncbi:putative Golgi apparatus membrane protein-like protein 1 [Thelohanellus kitauei]|uniref:Golgi apparatus membrane protein TVP23 homolog n=1 Tax=Thelohanellus kitauei TaxID=669202 RepID=A0A0C2IZ38_THEKT|nr:putative Golgi apparatus membrane protein-like protein 1 [Thelohanellus kitauei]